ncbi:glycosyltransferase [Gracilimonas mengyeensis]|uniref:Glycosyltransferase involved in cell wall bisynthesis n=1 Tax=Gracilimonas mengyeensis TaxID=1302730 RepID=A0A521DG75_9BACT|nr:glycosyltransferase [Gracilimonas mengyeensis]SMO70582.1 Glycosyltransferase involved in cell wall bisynthesis [Gracilimonas mengyeensis]
MNSQQQSSTIILYQPYYDFMGHFKDFFHLYEDYLTKKGFNTCGIIGTLSGESSGLNQKGCIQAFKSYTDNKFKRILANYAGFHEVEELLNQRKIDAVHFLDYEILSLASHLMVHPEPFQKTKIILTQHSVNFLTANINSSLLLTGYRKMAQKAYEFLDRNFDLTIVTNGKWITRSLQGFYSSDNTRFVTSTWGAHPPLSFSNEFKSPPNSFLYLGIIRKDKNLEYLLEQFSKVDTPFKLTIAGVPFDYSEEELLRLTQKSGIPEESLHIDLGFIEEDKYLQYLASNRYLVLPYSASNQSNSGPLIQAIQYGCIPIVSNYGERGLIVESNNLGYTFNFEQKDHLSAIVDAILNKNMDPNSYLNRLRQIKEQYQWKNILEDQILNQKIYS